MIAALVAAALDALRPQLALGAEALVLVDSADGPTSAAVEAWNASCPARASAS